MEDSLIDRLYKNGIKNPDAQHSPDVLSCLANLSNDEVFTPPEVVNRMLDMLPQELFSDPNTKFLDPACKTGVFLREIAKRLLIGLEPIYPDLQERIDHIFHNQLYGIAITELTSLLSRRSLYCSQYPNGQYSVSRFDGSEGNIRFKRIEHTWGKLITDVNGKQHRNCVYCGTSSSGSLSGSRSTEGLETHAYEFIHVNNPEDIIKMKFDVIISNCPYQLNDGGGTGDSARPIYHLFVEQAKKLEPRYLSMIIPSRWLKGGKGLDSFRETMMDDHRIEYIFDFENAKDIFPGIHLDGGVCYFLWNKKYEGKCKYQYTTANNEVVYSERYLRNDVSSTVIRDYRQISIIEKVNSLKEAKFNNIVSTRKPYGIATDLFNRPNNYPELDLSLSPKTGHIKIYGVKGKKGGAKRMTGYVLKKNIEVGVETIDKYKLFFSYAYSTDAVIPPQIIAAKPNEISTETFLRIGPFKNENQSINCKKYMETNFFRALLYFNRIQKNASNRTFELIPLLDFDREWNDEELFEKYHFTDKEKAFINQLFTNKNEDKSLEKDEG